MSKTVKKEKREILLPISETERAKFFTELLSLESSIDEKLAEIKTLTGSRKEEIKLMTKTRRHTRGILESGKAPKIVQCETTYDFTASTVETRHGKNVVESRAMTDADRQMDILPKKRKASEKATVTKINKKTGTTTLTAVANA